MAKFKRGQKVRVLDGENGEHRIPCGTIVEIDDPDPDNDGAMVTLVGYGAEGWYSRRFEALPEIPEIKVGDRVRVVSTKRSTHHEIGTEYVVGKVFNKHDGDCVCFPLYGGGVDSGFGCWGSDLEVIPETAPKVADDAPTPPHYLDGRPAQYEPRFVIAAWDLTYNLGSAVKYISRAGRKGSAEDHVRDLEKARDFLKFEIERLQGAGFYGRNDK